MLWLLLATLLTVARGATPDEVVARVQAAAPMRALRTQKSAPQPSEEEIRKAASGTIVSGVRGTTAWGVAVLNLPIGRLWAGLNDETRHPGYTATAYSELMSGQACASGRKVFQYLPVPMVDDRWWVSVLRTNQPLQRDSGGAMRELYFQGGSDPAQVISAAARKLIPEAAPIRSTRGGWFLIAIDPYTTYVEYHSNTDPGEGVPQSLALKLAARGVRETILAMEKFAKEGHPVCPVF
ncbi:MAG: hypothetical protein ABIO70_27560 [Pseudomonadota bacterium]